MRNHLRQNPESTTMLFMYKDFFIVLFHIEGYENQETVPFISYESSHKPTSCDNCSLSSKSF